jgi:hypothetical protein
LTQTHLTQRLNPELMLGYPSPALGSIKAHGGTPGRRGGAQRPRCRGRRSYAFDAGSEPLTARRVSDVSRDSDFSILFNHQFSSPLKHRIDSIRPVTSLTSSIMSVVFSSSQDPEFLLSVCPVSGRGVALRFAVAIRPPFPFTHLQCVLEDRVPSIRFRVAASNVGQANRSLPQTGQRLGLARMSASVS